MLLYGMGEMFLQIFYLWQQESVCQCCKYQPGTDKENNKAGEGFWIYLKKKSKLTGVNCNGMCV